MPEIPAPATNQLQIPDYSKTLNALAQQQLANAHAKLYDLQEQQQNLRLQAAREYGQTNDPQTFLKYGQPELAEQALKFGTIGQDAKQKFLGMIGSTLPTIPKEKQLQWVDQQLGHGHHIGLWSKEEAVDLYKRAKENPAGFSASLLSQHPEAVSGAAGLPSKEAFESYQTGQHIARERDKSVTKRELEAVVPVGSTPRGPVSAVPGAPQPTPQASETAVLGSIANDISKVPASRREAVWNARIQKEWEGGRLTEDTYKKYYGRPPDAATAKDLASKPIEPKSVPATTLPSDASLARTKEVEQQTAKSLYEGLPERINKNHEALSNLQQLVGHLADTKGSILTNPGPFAAQRARIGNVLNEIAKAGGWNEFVSQNKLAASDAANKLTSYMGFQDSTLLGHKEAADVVFANVNVQPGRESPEVTNQKLLAGRFALQKWQRDFHEYIDSHRSDPQAQEHFLKDHPITEYGKAAERLAHVPLEDMKLLIQNSDKAAKDIHGKGDNKTVRHYFDKHYGDGTSDLLLDR